MNIKFITLFLIIGVSSLSFGQEKSIDTLDKNDCIKSLQLIQNYQFEKAIIKLNYCYSSDSSNLDYLEKLAFCNLKLGRLKEAKLDYLEILINDTSNLNALNQLANIYAKESNNEAAINTFKKLESIDSMNSYYQKRIANLSLKESQIKTALVYYNKAISINSQDIEAIAELSNLYIELKFYPKADSLLRIGNQIDNSNILLLLYMAKSSYKQRKYINALSSANKIIELQEDTSIYLKKMMGISYFHTGDYGISIKTLNSVLKQNQASEIIYYYLALTYKANGNLEKSTQLFEKAIGEGISVNLATYYTNLAVSYEEQGLYGDAIRAYKAAYNSSKDKILLYHLARNYDTYYEDKNTAIDYYQKYLEANDTGDVVFQDYSKHRISELKQIKHFDIDSLNKN